MANAIPKSLNLADVKKIAVPAYRRQVIHNTTYQNIYQPGAVILLPIDTGTASAFMDTQATALEFSVTISNDNPMIDFVHLPRCGVNAFIREFSLEVNGVPIEMNRHYAESIEVDMIRKGENSKPYSLYHSNKWRPAHGNAGHTSINFIKPCMVDSFGQPMDFLQPFMDQNPAMLNGFGFKEDGDRANAYTAMGEEDVADASSAYVIPLMGTEDDVHTGCILHGSDDAAANIKRLKVKTFIPNLHDDSTKNFNQLETTETSNYINPSAASASSATNLKLRSRGTVPSLWPYQQPCSFNGNKYDYSKENGGIDDIRAQNILGFYSNVRCLPVGVVTGSNPSDFYGNLTVLSDITTKSLQLHCSIPLYSSIIGVKAMKVFAEALVPGGRMMAKFRLQEPEIALQVAMDPCRRVVRTKRDFVPFTGHVSGTDFSATVKTTDHLVPGVHPVQAIEDATGTNKVQGACLSSLDCMGKRALPILCLSTHADVDVDTFTPTTGTEINTLGGSLRNSIASSYNLASILPDMNTAFTSNLSYASVAAQTVGVGSDSDAGTNVTNNCNPYGLPLPQYIPISSPWLYKDATVSGWVYTNEAALCYGTYLECSRPQTRRCSSSLLELPTGASSSSITATTGASNRPTYQIQNVQLVTEQILLSASLTDELISSALSGGLEVNTTLIKESSVYMPKSATQTQLINIAGSSINDVSFWFRSTNQIQGDVAYGYPSFSFYNPFVNVGFAALSGAHVGGTYTVSNALTTTDSCGIDLQLQVASELYPRQPINSVPALIRETEKGDETLYQQKKKLDVLPHLMLPSGNTTLQYSPYQDGYFAAYLPIDALDDQTITGNPYFQLAESAQAQHIAIRGVRAASSALTANSTTGVLNIFEPLNGTFHITFNLNTFLGIRDMARSGATVVQNQMYLKMKNAHLCNNITVELLTFYNVDARIVYETGGNMRVYS